MRDFLLQSRNDNRKYKKLSFITLYILKNVGHDGRELFYREEYKMEVIGWIVILLCFVIGFIGLIYPIIPAVLFIFGGFVMYGLFFSFSDLPGGSGRSKVCSSFCCSERMPSPMPLASKSSAVREPAFGGVQSA